MKKIKSSDINYESEISKALSTRGYLKEFPMMTAKEAKKAFDKFVKTQKHLSEFLKPKI